MNDVFVIDALRTPFGSFGGSLAGVSAPQLAASVSKALLERSQLDPSALDQFIAGQVLSGGCGQAPARQAMRAAGIPDSVPALTINKVCGSGLKAMMLAADAIRLGDDQLAIAGGMESMSQAPYALQKARFGYRLGQGDLLDLMVFDGLQDPYSGKHMGMIAEAAVERHEISRSDQDEYAMRSYKLAQEAVSSGTLQGELTPVVIPGKKGDVTVASDEEPFAVNFDKLVQLRPVFNKDGSITAGNASTINDGAALSLLAGEEACKKHNLTPRARLVAYATNSLRPDLFTDAPVGAITAACAKAGLKLSDVDLFEVNEAFSAVALIAMRELDLPLEKVNVNGGAVAIGHPLGASGGRLVATVIRELHRRQARYGLATLCIGGGEAVAAIFERV